MKRIGIVGLGLMGGSVALAVRKRWPRAEVIGVSRSVSKLATARRRQIITRGSTQLSVLRDVPFVIVCTPVGTIARIVARLDRVAHPGTVVTDVGSTKAELARAIDRSRLTRIRFVGAHPMAGSHETGLAHAHAELFRGAATIVTKNRKTRARALRQVAAFWRALAGRVLIMTPEEHDLLAANISHVPHLVAALLVRTAKPRALRMLGKGFLDTTRVAQGDAALWTQILTTNRLAILRELKQLNRHLATTIQHLSRHDDHKLHTLLAQTAHARRQLEV